MWLCIPWLQSSHRTPSWVNITMNDGVQPTSYNHINMKTVFIYINNVILKVLLSIYCKKVYKWSWNQSKASQWFLNSDFSEPQSHDWVPKVQSDANGDACTVNSKRERSSQGKMKIYTKPTLVYQQQSIVSRFLSQNLTVPNEHPQLLRYFINGCMWKPL